MYEIIKLKEKLPVYGLMEGCIGTIIYEHKPGKLYEAEFLSLKNEMSLTICLKSDQFEVLTANEISDLKTISFLIT